MSSSSSGTPLLDVRDLSVSFRTRDGVVHAVSELSFTLRRGETLGVVGESGSGKSVSSLAIMGLLNRAYADVQGEILYEGRDLLKLSPRELRAIRGPCWTRFVRWALWPVWRSIRRRRCRRLNQACRTATSCW